MSTLVGVRRALTGGGSIDQGGGQGIPNPQFWLPLMDAGAGAVNTGPARAFSGSAPTFTRATAAWTKLASGLWASVATGIARSCYLGATTAVGAYGGYFAEEARTNLCLQSRDLSTTWTALNATLLKDQVGIDGVASSASSMLATAINGSALQTITEAATASALSMFIKRITGVGTVTIQQGVTTLEVSGSINSSTYTRVELDATVLNPIIGIVLGTSGDKIAVDMVQFENTAGTASSPIPTTTVSVARNADALTYPGAGNIGTIGTMYAEIVPLAATAFATNQRALQLDDTTNNNNSVFFREAATGKARFSVSVATVAQCNIDGGAQAQGVMYKHAGVFNTADFRAAVNGVFGTPVASGTVPAMTTIRIGNETAGVNPLKGMIKNIKLWNMALTNGQIASL